jgi:hypothetical protein
MKCDPESVVRDNGPAKAGHYRYLLQGGGADVLRRGEFTPGPRRGSRVGVAMDTRKHVSRKQNVGAAALIATPDVRA